MLRLDSFGAEFMKSIIQVFLNNHIENSHIYDACIHTYTVMFLIYSAKAQSLYPYLFL